MVACLVCGGCIFFLMFLFGFDEVLVDFGLVSLFWLFAFLV